ncbi:MAG: glycosyltransferase, partial [Armatimonadota bacterium]
NHVHITGFVPHEQVIQGLREADMFVFASKTETQGLVLGEAMACCLPVVAVESDAAREAIVSLEHGVLVPDQDAPFAEAMLALLRDHQLRSRLGHNAQARVESFSLQRCTERLVEVYQHIIG